MGFVELYGDKVQDYPVVKHAINFLEKETQNKIDYIALLRPTSPLRPPNLIEKAYQILKNNKLGTSVRSVVPVNQHSYRQWFVNGDRMIPAQENIFEPYNLPRQQLPQFYFQSGDIEFIKRSTLDQNTVSGDFILPLILENKDLYDIDTYEDLK